MKKLWKLFTSVGLTISLTIIVCSITAYGSLKVKAEPDYYSSIDTHVLVPWLFTEGIYDLEHSLWMILLIVSIFFFALNIIACTGSRTYSIIKNKQSWKSLIPQFIHMGFFIALIGHLLGSTLGFRSYSNVLYQGKAYPVPYNENLLVRLEGVETEYDSSGNPTGLRTKITLSDDRGDFFTDDIQFNDPVMYRGMVFYYVNHGGNPSGVNLTLSGGDGIETFSQPFYSNFTTSSGVKYSLGRIYPTFGYDENGKPYTRTDEYLNPFQEIRSSSGEVAHLDLNREGTSTTIDGKVITLTSFVEIQYAVLNINKDPGIGFIVVGSVILVLGTGMLLLFRRDRAELLKEPAFNRETDRTPTMPVDA